MQTILDKNEKIEIAINNSKETTLSETKNFHKIFLHSLKEIETACSAGKQVFGEAKTLQNGTSMIMIYIEVAFEDIINFAK